jgi:hypothetical protein
MVHQAKRNIRSSQISNTTHRPKSTVNKVMLYLYIMVDPDKKDRCKVGITKNVFSRLTSYRTANPDCAFFKVYNIPAAHHEKRILDLLKDVGTVRSEYVHLNPEFVAKVIEGYLKDCDL